MSLRRALAAALPVSLALLSACSEDEPVPQIPDPTTSVPSPTESTSTAAPETPEEFIRRFNEANAEMQATGETTAFLLLTRECRPCSETAERVESFYANGGYVKWAGWKIVRVRHDQDTEQGSDYRVEVVTPVTRYKESKAAEVQVLEGGNVVYRASLVSDEDSLAHLRPSAVVPMKAAAKWVALVLVSSALVMFTEARAAAVCVESADLLTASVTCEFTGDELRQKASADTEAVYEVFRACWRGESTEPELCSNPRACTVGEETGSIYAVLRNGVYIGTACLTAAEEKVFTPPIAAIVAKRFKSLDWPQSKPKIQPVGGQTLVNFETIFYTTNNKPTIKTLTLLGQTVEIEATPTSYTRHYGDETTATTSSAGHPYPDRDVVHTYTDLDAVAPSVDTVYSGRFRVNGGAREDIDETVTVAGGSVVLEIPEATPQLVTDPNQQ
ncbi:hypothetical protein [Nocardioides sp. B-3]|uniref:hypothetical protein n=1 Tax=Nocardioides sp. B-3 TaxID=2895565 RepID=UPI0021527ABE|nr:hypothetical protein [Nocardioides sp. B-3]UUZ60583.1 hypothetical protein LP418_06870 [Nocardioides sp. B-3]